MNIQKFYQAFYSRGFNKIDAYQLIGQIAVETKAFTKSKWSGSFKSGRRKVDISWVNGENGGTFSFDDIKESVQTNIKLQIVED